MSTSNPTVRLLFNLPATNSIAAIVAFTMTSQWLVQIAEQQSAPQAPADQPQLLFSPWTTFCLKGQEPGAQQVCFTGKAGRDKHDDSPSTDAAFKEQQQRLSEELARRAEEARKRLNPLLNQLNR
jgi:hypothetical protein